MKKKKKQNDVEPTPEVQEQPAAAPRKTTLSQRTAVKVIAFLLVIISALTLTVSVFSAYFMVQWDVYTTPKETLRQESFSEMAYTDALIVFNYLIEGDSQIAVQHLDGLNIAFVSTCSDRQTRWQYGSIANSGLSYYSRDFYVVTREDGVQAFRYYPPTEPYETVTVTVRLAKELTLHDKYFLVDLLIELAYTLRYWIYVIGAASLLVLILCVVFLLCASGHRKGYDTVQPGWGTKVPLDLLTAVFGFGVAAAIALVMDVLWNAQDIVIAIAAVALGLVFLALLLGWSMSLALRIKLGGWWKNTIIYRVLKLLWLLLCKVGRLLKKALCACGRGIKRLVLALPLVWKTAVGFVLLSIVEFIVIICLFPNRYGNREIFVALWFVEHMLLFAAVLYLALTLRKLQKGGAALAAGDLGHQVDTRWLLPEFKQHGEHLNRIGEGMTAAVEQRLKSERMKTELITNVSHDIKTPLTSIINYSDLICKEPCENENITQYADVLHRQSERLKRLIEDLVEASKASTGSLEVLLAPCEVGVLLTQTAGEYEQRLSERGLTLVTTQPEQPVRILADGRRLWRVIDNLMNNICKYGQSGTRVYLSLEQTGEQAVVTFKNTSRDPLNLSPDELMERFVQGDPSRTADGNGLGLSIAKSLTELQNGTLDLSIDGDLFKVILTFPVMK